MSTPLVSVVIPAWNREATIERAVHSVLAQTVPDIEVIVVDNGSTDGTVAVVEAIADDRVRLVRLPENRGPSGGRNAGAAVASAPLLGFLDSDDELDPEWAASLSAPLGDAAVAAASCGYRTFPKGDCVLPGPLGAAHFDLHGCFQAGTFLVRVDVFRAVGCYANELRLGENTELSLRLSAHAAASGATFATVDRALLIWHRSASNRYGDRIQLAAAEYTIEQHHAQLARDPFLLAAQHLTAGGAAVRLGDRASARRHFWRALRAQPTLKTTLRWLCATNDATARAAWRSRPVGPAGEA